MKSFRKAIGILEIPLYLLIIGTITLDEGYVGLSICLFTLSIIIYEADSRVYLKKWKLSW